MCYENVMASNYLQIEGFSECHALKSGNFVFFLFVCLFLNSTVLKRASSTKFYKVSFLPESDQIKYILIFCCRCW